MKKGLKMYVVVSAVPRLKKKEGLSKRTCKILKGGGWAGSQLVSFPGGSKGWERIKYQGW